MNQRTQNARDNDDSEIIDRAERTPSGAGSSGGNLQRDVGAQDEGRQVRDAENSERVKKEDDIAHDERVPVSGTRD